MFRRRPLARAAVIGGAGYMAGKSAARHAEQEAELDAYHQQEYAEQYAAQQQQQQAAAGPDPDAAFAQLEKLKKLLDEGVLTQAEFDAQKAKILAGT
jgi:membrane protease subunit (stomatin/prohibitin family)